MEVFLVYLWLKLDTFIGITTSLWIGLAIFVAASTFHILNNGNHIYEDYQKEWQQTKGRSWRKWRNYSLVSALIFYILSAAIPTSKETAILVGASIAVDVAKSPEGTKVAALLRGKANELLDEQINKLKKETK